MTCWITDVKGILQYLRGFGVQLSCSPNPVAQLQLGCGSERMGWQCALYKLGGGTPPPPPPTPRRFAELSHCKCVPSITKWTLLVLLHDGGFCNTCTMKRSLQRKVDFITKASNNAQSLLMFHNCSITKQGCYKTIALFYTFIFIKNNWNWIQVIEQYIFTQWRICLKNFFLM